jgi:hypothetical protein
LWAAMACSTRAAPCDPNVPPAFWTNSVLIREPECGIHSVTVLKLTACATHAGGRSLPAGSEWVADAPTAFLGRIGTRVDPLIPESSGPAESTIHRPKVCTVSSLLLPRARQAVQIARRRVSCTTGRIILKTVRSHQPRRGAEAPTARLAQLVRGRWMVEALCHVRGATFTEDACQLRTRNAPPTMATWRNLAIEALRPTCSLSAPRVTAHVGVPVGASFPTLSGATR